MPIYRLLEGKGLEPEHCQAISRAFEHVLQDLGLKDRNDPLCDLVAREIIELARQGVHNPDRLHEGAMKALKPAAPPLSK